MKTEKLLNISQASEKNKKLIEEMQKAVDVSSQD